MHLIYIYISMRRIRVSTWSHQVVHLGWDSDETCVSRYMKTDNEWICQTGHEKQDNQWVENRTRQLKEAWCFTMHANAYNHHSTCCPQFCITVPDPAALLKRPHRGNVIIWIQIEVVICGILNSLRWHAQKNILSCFLFMFIDADWKKTSLWRGFSFSDEVNNHTKKKKNPKFASWHFGVNMFTEIQGCV